MTIHWTTSLAAALLLALAAPGCGPSEEGDPETLLQTGEIERALELIDRQLAKIETGTEAEKELVILKAQGLSEDAPGEARDLFLGFAGEHLDLVTPGDFKYVVDYLRTHRHLLEAIDVMHQGKQRWPEDETMDRVLKVIETDASQDEAAKNKLRGLGYG